MAVGHSVPCPYRGWTVPGVAFLDSRFRGNDSRYPGGGLDDKFLSLRQFTTGRAANPALRVIGERV